MTTIVAFYANQNYIAAKLCENRSNPCAHCFGKCQLKKQLAAQNEEHDKLPAQNSHEEIFSLYTLPDPCTIAKFSDLSARAETCYLEKNNHSATLNSIFHPPC
jgi:hypothetical protein